MKYHNLLVFAFCILLLQHCNHKVDVESVINKFDKEDFNELMGKYIHYRSSGHYSNSSIYMVGASQGRCGPYVVDFSQKSKKVLEIENNLVISSCGKDYFSREEIKKAVEKFVKYQIFLLSVDNEGNVYIKPSLQGPSLLRKSHSSTPKDIRLFQIYKGNWYIEK